MLRCESRAKELVIFLLKQLFYLKGLPHKVFNSLRGLFGQKERSRHFAKIKAIFHSLFSYSLGAHSHSGPQ